MLCLGHLNELFLRTAARRFNRNVSQTAPAGGEACIGEQMNGGFR